MPTAWEEARRELHAELGAMFDIWVDPLRLHGVESTSEDSVVVHIIAPNEVYVSWLETQYRDAIAASLSSSYDASEVHFRLWVDGAPLPELNKGSVSSSLQALPDELPGASKPMTGVPAALFPDLPEPEPQPRSSSPSRSDELSALPQAARRFSAAGTKPVRRATAEVAPEPPAQPSLFDRVKPSVDELVPPGVPLPEDKTFDRFVVGGCNQFAHAAAQAVGDGPTGVRYNPLFIYGGTGLGKTHLMVAVGHRRLRRTPTARVLYVTGEQFTNELIEALRFKRMTEFRHKYRHSVDLLLLDDVQFISGKERTQEELFHTFQWLRERNRQIVFTADVLPRDIAGFAPRLRTRFESGMLADMQPPDHETLVAIVHDKAASVSLELTHDVARWIAARVRGSIREIEGVVNRLTALSELYREHVSVGFVRAHLGHALPDGPPSPEAEDILKVVASTFEVTRTELLGPHRMRRLVLPRHVAMFLVRKHTGDSFPEIGRRFGRDHTTVHHACRKIEQALLSDVELRQQVHVVERTLGC